jgi:hypothetical protein
MSLVAADRQLRTLDGGPTLEVRIHNAQLRERPAAAVSDPQLP